MDWPAELWGRSLGIKCNNSQSVKTPHRTVRRPNRLFDSILPNQPTYFQDSLFHLASEEACAELMQFPFSPFPFRVLLCSVFQLYFQQTLQHYSILYKSSRVSLSTGLLLVPFLFGRNGTERNGTGRDGTERQWTAAFSVLQRITANFVALFRYLQAKQLRFH
jgi:hypothetical protein